jgi:hypothetical protein
MRAVLIERGIDLCCGGSLTLREAAEVRGVALEELVRAVRQAAGDGAPVHPPEAPAGAPAIQATDSVRAVLAAHPQVAGVFEQHGLLGCGGPAGPTSTPRLFATMHRDAAALLAELTAAAARGAAAAAETTAPAAGGASTLHRRFLAAGLVATLTFGASFGATNLLAIHLALGTVPPAHNWLHAGFQVMGFVLLFIMGVAYHTVPRFLEPRSRIAWLARGNLVVRRPPPPELRALRSPRPAASWLAAGSSCSSPPWPASPPLSPPGGGRGRRRALQRFLASGTWGACRAAGWPPAPWRLAQRGRGRALERAAPSAALSAGAAGSRGTILRTGPVSAWPPRALVRAARARGRVRGPRRRRRERVDGRAPPLDSGSAVVGIRRHLRRRAGFRVRPAPLRLPRGPRRTAPGHAAGHAAGPLGADRSFPVSSGWPSPSRSSSPSCLRPRPPRSRRAGPSRLLLRRRAPCLALGFVTLMIFGMASRIVPIFGGVELCWPALRTAGACLIGIGVLLREAQVGAVLFEAPGLVRVSGLSGLVAALGVWLASLSLLGTLRAAARAGAGAAPAAPAAITAGANVAALVAAHPRRS